MDWPTLALGTAGLGALQWIAPQRARRALLAAAGATLIVALDPYAGAVMLAMAVATYLGARHIGTRGDRRAAIASAALIAAAGAYLVAVKIAPLLDAGAGAAAGLLVAPIGLSYLTFRLVHYAIEVRREGLPEHEFLDFAAYVTFFPIFFAGPIERFERFTAAHQGTATRADVLEGAKRLVFGAIKAFGLPPLILAAAAIPSVEEAVRTAVEAPATVGPVRLWLLFATSMLVTYLNFAGYCDLAIGSARLLGYRICENFDYPFLATSPSDFWRRWHISLGEWCRHYVFLPVARLTHSAMIGAVITFLVIGLWHQATAHWLCFGLWHGCGVVCENVLARRGLGLSRLGRGGLLLAWLATMAFVVLASAFTLLSGRYPLAHSFALLARAVGVAR